MIFFLIIFFAFAFSQFRSVLGTPLSWIGAPIYGIRHYIETSSDAIPVYFRSRADVDREIQSLQQHIESQNGIRVALEAITKENEELKLQLGATSTKTFLASVLARPPTTPYDTLVIDKGGRDGVISGAPVYYGADMALGYVRVVYPTYALVSLFSSPNVESTVYVYGPNIFAKAYGEGDGAIRISVPQGVSIKEGDIAVLPSLTRGILGRVYSIHSDPTEPEQSAYIVYDTPLQSLHFVRVGKESITPKTFSDALVAVQETEKSLFTFDVPPQFTQSTTSTSTEATTTQQETVPER